ncbi:Sodium/calcium exchanger protein-domain-containing protein [Desarmillaria tabescens]|uniref:Sodium/calcium exchanger protein-domain-containing protein n=1 Tax=Armillaria tabescens TaxID=1929756 RepID=A0AA39KBZ6_ARMTA|nr:Sodium/calcium exchanger protein-domain-containing protein [Desarmillaria tabescens]KAK0458305.1 Sodium/calcium exchanger protein-domain-containing protein [Desarmillaria tabescens]
MTEPSSHSTSHVLPEPTRNLTEDDDEPPSSGNSSSPNDGDEVTEPGDKERGECEPDRNPAPLHSASLLSALRYTPLNILLLCIPVSWALHFAAQSATLIFVFSALGIIPLAALLGYGTEQAAARTSASIGGLINATLGNVVEMIIGGVGLQKCDLELVQSSLLGGLLSNLFLMLGMAFLVGPAEQEFHPVVAQVNSSLMMAAVAALVVPTILNGYLEERLPQGEELGVLLELSRVSSVVLILVYCIYLYFQFFSHKHYYVDGKPHRKDSNAAEHTTAVVVAWKGKLDLAMHVAVGSSMQIALGVIPGLVLVAWAMGRPLGMVFDPVQTVVLFFTVLLVKFTIEDGRSHYLSGVVLVAVYTLVAVWFWDVLDAGVVVQGVEVGCGA